MERYELRYRPSIEKDLKRLSSENRGRVLRACESLRSDPFRPGLVKLAGTERQFRLRVGDYRIVFEIRDAAREVVIQYVRHRRDVYRRI